MRVTRAEAMTADGRVPPPARSRVIPVARPESAKPAVGPSRRPAKRRVAGSSERGSAAKGYRLPGPVLFFTFLLAFIVVGPVVAVLLRAAFPTASTSVLFVVGLVVGVLPFDLWFAFSPRTNPNRVPRPRYRKPRPRVTRRQRDKGVLTGILWGVVLIACGVYALDNVVADAEGGGVAGVLIAIGMFLLSASIWWLRVAAISETAAETLLPRVLEPDGASESTVQDGP